MRSKHDISVVMPLAEDGWDLGHLRATAESVRRQIRRGFVVHAVDGTKDGAAEKLLKEVLPPEILVHERLITRHAPTVLGCLWQGAGGAAGLGAKWVAYAEPGGVWRRDHLQRLWTAGSRLGLDVVFSGGIASFPDWASIPGVLRTVNVIDACGAIHTAAAYGRLAHGWRRERVWSDWDLWCQFAASGAKFGHDPQATSRRIVPRAGVSDKLREAWASQAEMFTGEDKERLDRWDSYVNSMRK